MASTDVTVPIAPQRNPIDDSGSPYLLHPADVSVKLVSDLFNEENYISWSKSFTMALQVKNKLGFVDGSISEPCPEKETVMHLIWMRVNILVLSWILQGLTQEIRHSFLYFTNAKETWDELKIRYARSDGPGVYHLEKCLNFISQGFKHKQCDYLC